MGSGPRCDSHGFACTNQVCCRPLSQPANATTSQLIWAARSANSEGGKPSCAGASGRRSLTMPARARRSASLTRTGTDITAPGGEYGRSAAKGIRRTGYVDRSSVDGRCRHEADSEMACRRRDRRTAGYGNPSRARAGDHQHGAVNDSRAVHHHADDAVRSRSHALRRPWFTLLQTFGLTDTYVVDNKFTPGETTGWHSHPGPSLIIVVAGTITNYDSDQKHCAGVSYSKGESFVDSGGSDVHTLVNRDDGECRDDRRPVHPERSAATRRPADRTSQLPRPVRPR